MKKFLLSLLAVFATTSAFAVTDVLKLSDFNDADGNKITASSYKSASFTSETTGVTYSGTMACNASTNFQFKKTQNGLWISDNPKGKIIKTVTVTIASGSAKYNVFEGTTNLTSSTSKDDLQGIEEKNATATFTFDDDQPYTSFLIYPTGAIYVSQITVEYADDVDPREYAELSFPEKNYEAFLGEDFTAPVLSSSVENALAFVTYTSSDETVATVDENGNVTILDDGATTISASIPKDNENYYSNTASYDLIVKDPNAIITLDLTADFFEVTTSYKPYTKEDPATKVGYTTVAYKSSGIQLNQSNAGCGIYVTTTSPNYIISSIAIEFKSANGGLDVYKQNAAYSVKNESTAVDTSSSNKVETAVKENKTIAIGAPAFALIPNTAGAVRVTKVTVTYARKAADDGSEYFECDAFHDYMVCKDDMAEIVLPEDAPEVKFTVANENIAKIENGVIYGYKPGNTKVTATWDAVPGKWMAGVEEFTVYVKYSTLAEVLEDASKVGEGFVHEGERYIGNFRVVVGSDNGKYNYVTDGTAWALFYVDHNHGEGAVLEAGWSGIYKLQNGLPEFTDIQHTDITDFKGEYEIKSYEDLTVDESVINEVLVLKDVTFNETTPGATGTVYTAKYSGQTLDFFNRFEIDAVEAGTYDVKCAVSSYKEAIQLYPIAYTALEPTTAAVHVDAELKVGEQIKFTGLEEGAHVYYRHGGENPDHTNVFTEETTPANAPRKAADVDKAWTYNHTTHPLTYQGEPMQVKYYAKAPGKAPSAVNELNVDENGSTTGIENVAVDAANGAVEYFNLQGIRVVNPENGVFIRRQGNDVKKVVL